jgi:hypothetical protein
MSALEQFAARFDRRDQKNPTEESELNDLEQHLNIKLPGDYRRFMLAIGSAWTPEILDIIVARELEMQDVQNFFAPDVVLNDKRNGWSSKVDPPIIPFASDCVGNTIGFLESDLSTPLPTASVYVFDHDLETLEKVHQSFSAWIEAYNAILGQGQDQ